MIRPANLSDMDALLDIAVKQTENYPMLKPDLDKIKSNIKLAISSPKHIVLVFDNQGEVTGTIAGITNDNMWAQRQNCHIVLWYAKQPGTGRALLVYLREWVKTRRVIKVAGMMPDFDLDSRVLKIAERAGFKRHGGAFLWYREVKDGSI